MTFYEHTDHTGTMQKKHLYRQQLSSNAKLDNIYPAQDYSSAANRDFIFNNQASSSVPIKNLPTPKMSIQKDRISTPVESTSDSENVFQAASSMLGNEQRTGSTVLNNNQIESYSSPSFRSNQAPMEQEQTPVKDYEPPTISTQYGNQALHHYRSFSSSSSLPAVPDAATSIGSRNFSTPLHHMSSNNLSSRSQSPSSDSHQTSTIRKHDRQSKSVDLSHLYLLDRNESTHFTLTNEHLSDQSHALIKQYLGDNNALLPRMKTVEMYRENVKKSNDPKVLFQYAQYMLQTALTIDIDPTDTNTKEKKHVSDVKKSFLKEAVHYLKKLSDKGYTDAQYLLADAHSSSALGKVDNKEAFALFQGAAKHGHIESAYRTAYCYEEGLGTSRDSRRAIEFLKFAASKNHPAAMFKLGMYSFNAKMGLSNNVNTKKTGINWLARAATVANELTNAAPLELGKIHERGFLDIIIPDRKYAFELYIQAASLGNIKAAAILGKAYEFGDEDRDDIPENQKIIMQDPSLAIHYYTQAAVGGDAESMLALCAWYLVGHEPALAKDETEGLLWAVRAANLNHPKAQYTVGHLYEKGIGCEANQEEANFWYNKALKNGDERAIKKLGKRKSVAKLKASQDNLNNTFKQSNDAPTCNNLASPKDIVPSSTISEASTGIDSTATTAKEAKKRSNKTKKDKNCSIM